MQIESIPLDRIEVGERLRTTDPDAVLFIAASVAEEGVRSPIVVRPADERGRYKLVVGAHRLAAAKRVGLAAIPATVEAMSDDEAKLHEIDENVYRYDLTELDQAVFLATRKAIHECLNPHTRRGHYLRSGDDADHVAIFRTYAESFSKEARERLGYSKSKLHRILKRAEIAPDVRERIALTPLARNGSELDKLVKLDPDQQRAAVELILSGDPDAPKTVAEAAAKLDGRRDAPRRPDDDLQLAELQRQYRAAGSKARQRFADMLAADPEWGPILAKMAAERGSLHEAR